MEKREATPEEKAQIARLKAALAVWGRKTHCSSGAHPECPYCKASQDIDAGDIAGELSFYSGDDESEEEINCSECGRPFKMKCSFTVEWESTMTDEEFEVEEAKRPDPNQISIFG